MKAPIHIWTWDTLPNKYRKKIKDVDDIDWIAVIDKNLLLGDYVPDFMETEVFAPCNLEVIDIGKEKLVVAYHS